MSGRSGDVTGRVAGGAVDKDLAEILAGLGGEPKRLSPKYFYDERGSELFERICRLPEYYLTRAERQIMSERLPEIASRVGPQAAVIEFGAGSIDKARRLLRRLESPIAYVPVEISGDYLQARLAELAEEFPTLSIRPVIADFTRPFDLPRHSRAPERNLVFFPGSTIGNFVRSDARSLLEVMREEARPGGALLIGVDLIKEKKVVEAAYNDSAGVTACFNRNVLKRLNDRYGANFDLRQFRHEAVYDEARARIEMRLVAMAPQSVEIAGRAFALASGEPIVTEYSHKYSCESFAELAGSAGWEHEAVWTDADALFSVHFLTAP